MSAKWIMTLPLVGIAYSLAAASCAVWAIRRKTEEIIWSLTGLMFSIAILNTYVEEWSALKWLRFDYAAPALVVLFLLPYRSFCLRLIERTGLQPRLAKEQYSFLTLAYAGFLTVMIMSFFLRGENPAFQLLTFIALVCALHVPMFAAGRSKIVHFLVKSRLAKTKTTSDISWSFFAKATSILGAPLAVAFIGRTVLHDDYRLFAVDAVLTAVILSLLAISRRGQFEQPVSERQANYRQDSSNLSPPFDR